MKPPFRAEPLKTAGFLFLLFCLAMVPMENRPELRRLYLLFLTVPLFSLVHLLFCALRFRFYQDFSSLHPSKGEEFLYTLVLSNESPLPGCSVRVSLSRLQPESLEPFRSFRIALKPRQRLTREFRFPCRYRGTYTVGLEEVVLEDVFRWFRISLPVWTKTFYIYPRAAELEDTFSNAREGRPAPGSGRGGLEDISRFSGYRSYRTGDSSRFLDRRKLAATGQAVIRQFDSLTCRGIWIFLDTRRAGGETPGLEEEDCSLEIAASLLKHFLRQGIPAGLSCYGSGLFRFAGDGPEDFERFRKASVGLLYGDFPGITDLLAGSREETSGREILVITHRPDPELIQQIAGAEGPAGENTGYLFNVCGWDLPSLEKAGAYLRQLKSRGRRIFLIRGYGSIAGDLRE